MHPCPSSQQSRRPLRRGPVHGLRTYCYRQRQSCYSIAAQGNPLPAVDLHTELRLDPWDHRKWLAAHQLLRHRCYLLI